MINLPKIAFIGSGNMACCIIQGLLADGFPAEKIIATRRNINDLSFLSDQGVQVSQDNLASIEQADIVVLGVKPFQVHPLLCKLKEKLLEKKPILISLAVGLPITRIEQAVNGALAVIRLMPNLPIQVRKGVCITYANALASDLIKNEIQAIFGSISLFFWVKDESLIDRCAAITGSGPAYFYYFMEGLIEGACHLGLSEKMAKSMVLETAMGALMLLDEKQEKITVLRKQVTSPGGTTAAAINSFQLDNWHASIRTGLDAAVDRANELSRSLV